MPLPWQEVFCKGQSSTFGFRLRYDLIKGFQIQFGMTSGRIKHNPFNYCLGISTSPLKINTRSYTTYTVGTYFLCFLVTSYVKLCNTEGETV